MTAADLARMLAGADALNGRSPTWSRLGWWRRRRAVARARRILARTHTNREQQ